MIEFLILYVEGIIACLLVLLVTFTGMFVIDKYIVKVEELDYSYLLKEWRWFVGICFASWFGVIAVITAILISVIIV